MMIVLVRVSDTSECGYRNTSVTEPKIFICTLMAHLVSGIES